MAFVCFWPGGTGQRNSAYLHIPLYCRVAARNIRQAKSPPSRLTRASQGTRTQIWDASPQIRFRLFTGNYSQYTFQCVTSNAADAALALKGTLTNLRLATVPEAYSLFPAEQSCCVCVCVCVCVCESRSCCFIAFTTPRR